VGMRKLLKKYIELVRFNCEITSTSDRRTLTYWQNDLFATTLMFVIPLSLIALIPSVYFTFTNNYYVVGLLDVASFSAVIIIGFARSIKVEIRKFAFIYCIYFVALFLLIYAGSHGPGLIFLYAGLTFAILILPKHFAFYWSALNITICAFFAIVLYLNLSPNTLIEEDNHVEWLIISSNLIFLSLMTSILLPKLLKGLEDTLKLQISLQTELENRALELNKAIKIIEEKNKDLEEFAFVASHDLHEPLRMITSFMGRLETKYADQLDEKGRMYIHHAVNGSVRMKQILEDLLKFSRAGRFESNYETVDLEEVIEEIKLIFAKQLVDNRIELKTQKLPVILGYRSAISQVFQNLISNSIKYSRTDNQPIITISAEETQTEYIFQVDDNGIGIDEGYYNKIFVIFQRLHGPSEYSGTGIGLAIVKKIVDRWNGRIWVDKNPSGGTTFKFTLPKEIYLPTNSM